MVTPNDGKKSSEAFGRNLVNVGSQVCSIVFDTLRAQKALSDCVHDFITFPWLASARAEIGFVHRWIMKFIPLCGNSNVVCPVTRINAPMQCQNMLLDSSCEVWQYGINVMTRPHGARPRPEGSPDHMNTTFSEIELFDQYKVLDAH